MTYLRTTGKEKHDALKSGLEDRARLLRSMRDRVADGLINVRAGRGPDQPDPGLLSQDVFVVHGHDEKVELEVAQLIEVLTTRRPTILHEQPNKGRTLIEKFEQNAIGKGLRGGNPDRR